MALWHWMDLVARLGPISGRWRCCTLRGRRGTWRCRPSFCILVSHVDLRFAWEAWRLLTSTFVLCGRRGTYGTGLDLVARLGPVTRRWRRGTLRGRSGTWRHSPSFCVAGVALGDIDLRFAWRAGTYGTGLDLVARLGPVSRRWRRAMALCVAGVALAPFCMAGVALISYMALGWIWQWHAWGPLVAGDAAALCVAGAALGDIHLRFAWQAWHLVTSILIRLVWQAWHAGSGGTLGAR